MDRIQTEIETALRVGDYFRTYDLATSGLESDPANLNLQYTILLALARTGANRQARARLNALLDSAKPKKEMPEQLAEDFAAMDARLFKNLAFEETGEKRRTLAIQSARRYEAAYAIKGGHFPAINAAAMWLIADEPEKSRAMAHSALANTEQESGYWPLASAAEAHLLLGEAPAARNALASAMALPSADLADKAVTRRQMALLCDKLGISWPSIDVPPTSIILHYCSDEFGEMSSSDTEGLGDEIDRLISGHIIDSAFGAIRNNAELLVAERLLAHGVDVLLVLPSGPKSLAETIGDKNGVFLRRLEACIEKLRDPPIVMTPDSQGSDALFTLSGRCAIGLAVMRAGHLMMDAKQVVFRPTDTHANSVSTRIVDISNRSHGELAPIEHSALADAAPRDLPLSGYETKALVFCDIKGFSKIPERAIPAFIDLVLGGLAEEINKYQSDVEYKETAGDGIYIVFREVVAAANCALALAARMNSLPPGPLPPLGIRVSAHVGAVFPTVDPVTGFRKFFGSEVVRAARIEPITPVGECYVTEQFASILALEGPNKFNCDYAGVLESAKGYGAFRMYSLRHRKAAERF
jgi:adenylate cyclase